MIASASIFNRLFFAIIQNYLQTMPQRFRFLKPFGILLQTPRRFNGNIYMFHIRLPDVFTFLFFGFSHHFRLYSGKLKYICPIFIKKG